MAGPGAQDRSAPLLGDTSQDELGVLPNRMGKATAAMNLAARIVCEAEVARANFFQNRKEKVTGARRCDR